MEMIAFDDQPFSIVENWGFPQLIEQIELHYSVLSQQYFSDVSPPALHEVVATHIHIFLFIYLEIDIGKYQLLAISAILISLKKKENLFGWKRRAVAFS